MVQRFHIREPLEFLFMVGSALGILTLSAQLGKEYHGHLIWAVVFLAVIKTGYYFAETLWHLVQATAKDLPYHRFLILMAYNMAEVTLSYALDFYCLHRLDNESFSGIPAEMNGGTLLFECLYFSVLNFSFFGYGDITPSHIPAKIVMLLEVVTAFTTVIFLISDFVSMKDSMRKRPSA